MFSYCSLRAGAVVIVVTVVLVHGIIGIVAAIAARVRCICVNVVFVIGVMMASYCFARVAIRLAQAQHVSVWSCVLLDAHWLC